jgi:hypothetical protein
MSFVGGVSKRAAALAVTGLVACANVIPLDETDASGAAGGDSLSGTTGGHGQPTKPPGGTGGAGGAPPTSPGQPDAPDAASGPAPPSEPPSGPPAPPPPPPPEANGQSWTILVYMVADTNLEPYGMEDLIEMAGVGAGPGFRIVAQVDRAAAYTSDAVLNVPNWVSALRMEVGRGRFDVVDDVGEPNMGAPETLSDFIAWGISQYPADRYGLVLWDHGGGIIGFGGDESAQSDLLSLPEMQTSLDEGLAASGERFAFVGFDACLMATWETAVVLAPHAEYLLASEELEPGHGWDYHSFDATRRDPTTHPVALGSEIVAGFFDQAAAQQTSADITLSVVDLTRVHLLTAALEAFGQAVGPGLAKFAQPLGIAQTRAETFAASGAGQGSMFGLVDLADLMAGLVQTAPEAAGPARAVIDALSEVVVEYRNGPAHPGARGLSVYFPLYAEHYDPAYDAIPGIDAWRDLLLGFFQFADALPHAPDFVGEATVRFGPDGEAIVTAELTPDTAGSVVQATLYSGAYVGANRELVLLNAAPANLPQGSTTVTGVWYLDASYVVQGDTSGYCYVSLEDRDGHLVAGIPFWYAEPGGEGADVVMQVVIDPRTGAAQQTTFYVLSGELWSELSPVPGPYLWPIVYTLDQNGDFQGLLSTPYGLDPTRNDFAFYLDDFRQQRDFSFQVWLTAVNLAGEGDSAGAQGTR